MSTAYDPKVNRNGNGRKVAMRKSIGAPRINPNTPPPQAKKIPALAVDPSPAIPVAKRRTVPVTRKKRLAGIIALVIIVMALVAAGTGAIVFGTAKNSGDTKSAPSDFSSKGLELDYAISETAAGVSAGSSDYVIGNARLYLNVTVKGSLKDQNEKLALVLTDYDGNAQVQGTITKEDLILGKHQLHLPLEARIGKQFLTLRSHTTQKDVCRKEISFSLEKFGVKDVKLNFEAANPQFIGNPSGKAKHLKTVDLVLEKTGNLPLTFGGCFLQFKGRHIERLFSTTTVVDGVSMECWVKSGTIMTSDRHTVKVYPPYSNALFEPGAKYRLEVKLPFGEGKTIDFAKEVVVP